MGLQSTQASEKAPKGMDHLHNHETEEKRQGTKVPHFFPLQPLISWAFSDQMAPPLSVTDSPAPNSHLPPPSLPPAPPISHLLDKLLVQLRLTTLMRASDLANIAWGIFHMGTTPKAHGPLYLHTNTKTGARQTYSIMGTTALTLVEYTWHHRDSPAPYLIRHQDHQALCMGPERIAKRCMNIMRHMGIDTTMFKSHALRGATATHLAKKGVPLPWIQARGGWSSMETLREH
jgi:integrase